MTLLSPPNPELATLRHRRFSVEEYRRMSEAGILTEDDNVELLEGWIVEKMTKNARHDAVIDAFNEAIRTRIVGDWRVRIQSAVTLSDSEPEPDIAVVRGPVARYVHQHPGAEDIAMLVEVAESSLAFDRGVKLPVYARASIPLYWIANLIEDVVEVYWDPTGPVKSPSYLSRRSFKLDDDLPLSIGGQQLKPLSVRQVLLK